LPQAIPVAWSRAAARAVVAACAFSLLATAAAVAPGPASATGLGDQISANRSGQLYAERSMRAQDQILSAVKGDLKRAKRDLKRAKRDRKRVRHAAAVAAAVVRERKSRLARVEAEYDDAAEPTSAERFAERLRGIRREIRIAERRKRTLGIRARAATRVVNARKARLNSLKRAKGVAISRREAAEASLASHIVAMTRLAAARADNQTAVSLTGSAAFSWPTTGRISQTYGCTGFYLNPRRGSCRHFHDGVDIVDSHGTPVRAVAVGVVAYTGWNPWDEGGRAWIVVVVHPDGFVSRYGHLTPTDRVRAGELVHTGQIIGKMGNTGKSTGTHLHFELLRGNRDVNPLSYLPAGVIKIDKSSTKAGQQARKKQQKARQRARKEAQARRAAMSAEQDASEATLVVSEACRTVTPSELDAGPPADPADMPADVAADITLDCAAGFENVTGPSQLSAALLSAVPPAVPVDAATETLGVPRPERGTSPAPA